VITTEEETRSCNSCLEIELVNYIVKDFCIVFPIRLLDAIESLIQFDKGSGPAIWIRPFDFREAHIESLMQMAAEEGIGMSRTEISRSCFAASPRASRIEAESMTAEVMSLSSPDFWRSPRPTCRTFHLSIVPLAITFLPIIQRLPIILAPSETFSTKVKTSLLSINGISLIMAVDMRRVWRRR